MPSTTASSSKSRAPSSRLNFLYYSWSALLRRCLKLPSFEVSLRFIPRRFWTEYMTIVWPSRFTSCSSKIKLLTLLTVDLKVYLLIRIVFIGALRQINFAMSTFTPRIKNWGFVSPTTPHMTSPMWIPMLIFALRPSRNLMPWIKFNALLANSIALTEWCDVKRRGSRFFSQNFSPPHATNVLPTVSITWRPYYSHKESRPL